MSTIYLTLERRFWADLFNVRRFPALGQFCITVFPITNPDNRNRLDVLISDEEY